MTNRAFRNPQVIIIWSPKLTLSIAWRRLGAPDSSKVLEPMGRSEDFMAEMGRYNEELSKAGVLVDLAALHWSAEGVRVKFYAGKRTVIEGPFGDAKEIVAGYWILQVKSMDEAIEWAKRLPFEAGGEPEAEGEIEIRRVFEPEEFGQPT